MDNQVLNSIDVYVEDEQLLFEAALTQDSINLYTRETPDIINIKEITDGMTIKIRGAHGVALLKVFGKVEKPEASTASFEVVDGILKCKGEGIVVENGILKLPVGEVRDGILYL